MGEGERDWRRREIIIRKSEIFFEFFERERRKRQKGTREGEFHK
jgi:hypothetical protein